MQTAYRCKHCKYVHVGKVSSCDCNNTKFEYTLVQIIDVPENEDGVPDFKTLAHSRGPRFVNYQHGTYGNGIYELQGFHENGRPIVSVLGNMSSSLDHTDLPYKVIENNRKANCVMAAGGPKMLEALFMCYQYFHLKREVQGRSVKNDSRIAVIAEAIRESTDLSVFDTPQLPQKED